MTITMELEEYEALKAEAAKAVAQLNLWDKFLDEADKHPNMVVDGKNIGAGSAIYDAFLNFKPDELLHPKP